MSMRSSHADPDAYVAALTGWQRPLVETLRAAVHSAGLHDERIKWGHLVYAANGPVLLIRAEAERVLFGFWRGKRLRALDPALKASGKYEMATRVLREGDTISAAHARTLATAAAALNVEFGDPTAIVRGASAAAGKGKTGTSPPRPPRNPRSSGTTRRR